LAVVLVRSDNLFCALPLASVIETLRSPPITAIAGAPEWVQGVAVIRGATVVIVDLGILLGPGSAEIKQARVVTLRVGARVVGLAVESIIGVREFDRTMLSEVPPLLLQAHPEVLTAIGLLDGELMLVLDGSRIITEQELARLEDS
jgi:purine-binding chemotaxis protein CheW